MKVDVVMMEACFIVVERELNRISFAYPDKRPRYLPLKPKGK
jgi:hypothetical protein